MPRVSKETGNTDSIMFVLTQP